MILLYFSKLILAASSLLHPVAGEAGSKQGLQGFVYRISGNQMPSPDKPPSKPKGVATNLYIFELTSLSQVSRQGQTPFYSAVHTKLIKKIQTDSTGHFCIELPAGTYSLFTKKDQLFYANTFDGNSYIAPVVIAPGKMTSIEIRMDFDAFY